MTQTTTITCDKCKTGTMVTTKVPRMADGLRVIGYTLWIPALLVVVLGTACGMFVTGGAGSTVIETIADAKAEAVAELSEVENLPSTILATFESAGRIPETDLAMLEPDQRLIVNAILATYDASLVGVGLGSVAATGIGTVWRQTKVDHVRR